MSSPPSEIDGAIVLEWAWSGDLPFGTLLYESGEVAAEIYVLAICRYSGAEEVYRFSCTGDWESEQDSVNATIAEAKDNLPKQYKNVEACWRELS